jgi:protein SCO1/2
MAALAGLFSFIAAALFILYVVPFRGVSGAPTTTSIGGPFTLVDDTGATVTEKTLAGKPYTMYFGYTFCPDVCPTTLLDLSRWINKLGTDADRLNYVFVTVDPERDTVQSLHAYLSSFDKRIRGYTGTPAEIAQIAREYRVYYRKVPTDDGGYTMDHSAIIYLIGPGGKFVTVIPYQEDDASALAKFKNLAGTITVTAMTSRAPRTRFNPYLHCLGVGAGH